MTRQGPRPHPYVLGTRGDVCRDVCDPSGARSQVDPVGGPRGPMEPLTPFGSHDQRKSRAGRDSEDGDPTLDVSPSSRDTPPEPSPWCLCGPDDVCRPRLLYPSESIHTRPVRARRGRHESWTLGPKQSHTNRDPTDLTLVNNSDSGVPCVTGCLHDPAGTPGLPPVDLGGTRQVRPRQETEECTLASEVTTRKGSSLLGKIGFGCRRSTGPQSH